MASDCLFCKIVEGSIPSFKVYENEATYAFLDINPSNLGHTLVVPKRHFTNIYELPEQELSALTQTTQRIAKVLKELRADGVNIIINNDVAAGQAVFHAHTHVIPRYTDDGYRHWRGPVQ